MISIQTRLLVSAAAISITFLTITGVLINNGFSKQVKHSIFERLSGYSLEIYYKSVDAVGGNSLYDNLAGSNDDDLSPVLSDEEQKKQVTVARDDVKASDKHKPSAKSTGVGTALPKSKLTAPAPESGEQPTPKPDSSPQANNDVPDNTRRGKKNKGVDVEETKKKYAGSAAIGSLQDFVFRDTGLQDDQSGLYAQIVERNKKTLWRSLSLESHYKRPDTPVIPFNADLKLGDHTKKIMQDEAGERYFAVTYSIVHVKQVGHKTVRKEYQFQISEAFSRHYDVKVGEFRNQLIRWLTGLTATLLMTMTLVLKWWGLGPLRKVSKELDQIKAGEAQNITGDYPTELAGLTDGIKTLIVSERAQQERYRNSLGDLAHSLKTPLAVLSTTSQNSPADAGGDIEQTIREQVERMRQIVDYQLQRAAASGRTTLMTPVEVKQSIQRIINTLDKAYSEKHIQIEADVEESTLFIGDEGDLLELTGNLLDNACKMCHQRVRVSGRMVEVNGKASLRIDVEDDGPGIDEDKIQGVLKRGFRADQSHSGQGIGLAVVKEIVHAYKAQIDISRSSLGGAQFTIQF